MKVISIFVSVCREALKESPTTLFIKDLSTIRLTPSLGGVIWDLNRQFSNELGNIGSSDGVSSGAKHRLPRAKLFLADTLTDPVTRNLMAPIVVH